MQVNNLPKFLLLSVIPSIILINCKVDIDKSKRIEECKAIENATDDDVERFLEHIAVRGANGRCLIACIFEHLGVIQNGSIQIDVLKATALEEHKPNQKPNDPIFDIIEECRIIKHPERCALAGQLKDCLDKSSLFRGKYEPDHGLLIP